MMYGLPFYLLIVALEVLVFLFVARLAIWYLTPFVYRRWREVQRQEGGGAPPPPSGSQ